MNAGVAANVIPDSVTMGGSIRTFDEDTRTFVKERMEQISTSIATAFRAEAELTFGSGCPTLTNDKDVAECAERYTRELLGDSRAFTVAQLQSMGGGSSKSAGSEDFAYVSHCVPSVMLALAAGQPEKGYAYPQHHPMVKFDESALGYGSAVYAYTAMRWLEEHK
jgi:hippurate hydrolase